MRASASLSQVNDDKGVIVSICASSSRRSIIVFSSLELSTLVRADSLAEDDTPGTEVHRRRSGFETAWAYRMTLVPSHTGHPQLPRITSDVNNLILRERVKESSASVLEFAGQPSLVAQATRPSLAVQDGGWRRTRPDE